MENDIEKRTTHHWSLFHLPLPHFLIHNERIVNPTFSHLRRHLILGQILDRQQRYLGRVEWWLFSTLGFQGTLNGHDHDHDHWNEGRQGDVRLFLSSILAALNGPTVPSYLSPLLPRSSSSPPASLIPSTLGPFPHQHAVPSTYSCVRHSLPLDAQSLAGRFWLLSFRVLYPCSEFKRHLGEAHADAVESRPARRWCRRQKSQTPPIWAQVMDRDDHSDKNNL